MGRGVRGKKREDGASTPTGLRSQRAQQIDRGGDFREDRFTTQDDMMVGGLGDEQEYEVMSGPGELAG